MKKTTKQALWEAAKELGRVLILAAVGWGISYLSTLPTTQTTIAVLAVLRWLDKFLHENKAVKLSGLVPF